MEKKDGNPRSEERGRDRDDSYSWLLIIMTSEEFNRHRPYVVIFRSCTLHNYFNVFVNIWIIFFGNDLACLQKCFKNVHNLYFSHYQTNNQKYQEDFLVIHFKIIKKSWRNVLLGTTHIVISLTTIFVTKGLNIIKYISIFIFIYLYI